MSKELWVDGRSYEEVFQADTGTAIFNMHEDICCLKEDNEALKAQLESLKGVATTYVRDSYRPSPKHDARRFDDLVAALDDLKQGEG